jgi:hypothetical protein
MWNSFTSLLRPCLLLVTPNAGLNAAFSLTPLRQRAG